MTKSPRKNVPDVGIELWAACMPRGHASDRTTAPGILSCFSKLCTSVLNLRLHHFLKQSNILEENQVGFRAGYSTTDHIFVLHTLIEVKPKKLFCYFVDFISQNYVVWPIFFLMNVFIALKGTHFSFLFAFVAAGVVHCGGRKTSPLTSTIVQFIFSFGPLRSAWIFWDIRNKWMF